MNKFIFLYGLVASTVLGFLFSSQFATPAISLLFFSLFLIIGRLDSLSKSL